MGDNCNSYLGMTNARITELSFLYAVYTDEYKHFVAISDRNALPNKYIEKSLRYFL